MVVEKKGYPCGGIRREDAYIHFECTVDVVTHNWVWADNRLFNVHLPSRRSGGIFGIRWEEKPPSSGTGFGDHLHRRALKPVVEKLITHLASEVWRIEAKKQERQSTLKAILDLDWCAKTFWHYHHHLHLHYEEKKEVFLLQIHYLECWFE